MRRLQLTSQPTFGRQLASMPTAQRDKWHKMRKHAMETTCLGVAHVPGLLLHSPLASCHVTISPGRFESNQMRDHDHRRGAHAASHITIIVASKEFRFALALVLAGRVGSMLLHA